jgi:hypothetical protein
MLKKKIFFFWKFKNIQFQLENEKFEQFQDTKAKYATEINRAMKIENHLKELLSEAKQEEENLITQLEKRKKQVIEALN